MLRNSKNNIFVAIKKVFGNVNFIRAYDEMLKNTKLNLQATTQKRPRLDSNTSKTLYDVLITVMMHAICTTSVAHKMTITWPSKFKTDNNTNIDDFQTFAGQMLDLMITENNLTNINKSDLRGFKITSRNIKILTERIDIRTLFFCVNFVNLFVDTDNNRRFFVNLCISLICPSSTELHLSIGSLHRPIVYGITEAMYFVFTGTRKPESTRYKKKDAVAAAAPPPPPPMIQASSPLLFAAPPPPPPPMIQAAPPPLPPQPPMIQPPSSSSSTSNALSLYQNRLGDIISEYKQNNILPKLLLEERSTVIENSIQIIHTIIDPVRSNPHLSTNISDYLNYIYDYLDAGNVSNVLTAFKKASTKNHANEAIEDLVGGDGASFINIYKSSVVNKTAKNVDTKTAKKSIYDVLITVIMHALCTIPSVTQNLPITWPSVFKNTVNIVDFEKFAREILDKNNDVKKDDVLNGLIFSDIHQKKNMIGSFDIRTLFFCINFVKFLFPINDNRGFFISMCIYLMYPSSMDSQITVGGSGNRNLAYGIFESMYFEFNDTGKSAYLKYTKNPRPTSSSAVAVASSSAAAMPSSSAAAMPSSSSAAMSSINFGGSGDTRRRTRRSLKRKSKSHRWT